MLNMSEGQFTPPPPPPPQESAAPTMKSRKKTWLAIALVVILAVAAVGTGVLLSQPSILQNGQIVTLSCKYNVGQKMTYSMKLTMRIPGQDIQNLTLTVSEEILTFDGTTYTIQTVARSPGQQDQNNVIKMDTTGRIADYGNTPSLVQQTFNSIFGIPGFGAYFPQTQAKVGETWTVPFDTNIIAFNTHGTVTNKITEITSVTTAGQTFAAFKNTMTAQMQLTTDDPSGNGGSGTLTMNFNGYDHMEKDTCTLLDFSMDVTATMIANGQTQTMNMTLSMNLTNFERGNPASS
jgi:hypothetical protein